MSKREDQLSGLVREIFGGGLVGLCAIGLSPSKTQKARRKRPRRSAVRDREGVYEVNDETPPPDDERRGMVNDIIIEASMPSTPAGVGAGVYLTNWEGYSTLIVRG